MQELNKATQEQTIDPILIQLLSQPYLGAIIMKGGPAQFGPSLIEHDAVSIYYFCVAYCWI